MIFVFCSFFLFSICCLFGCNFVIFLGIPHPSWLNPRWTCCTSSTSVRVGRIQGRSLSVASGENTFPPPRRATQLIGQGTEHCPVYYPSTTGLSPDVLAYFSIQRVLGPGLGPGRKLKSQGVFCPLKQGLSTITWRVRARGCSAPGSGWF